jgi:hypothetical protein
VDVGLIGEKKTANQFAGARGQNVIGEQAYENALQAGTEGRRTHRRK